MFEKIAGWAGSGAGWVAFQVSEIWNAHTERRNRREAKELHLKEGHLRLQRGMLARLKAEAKNATAAKNLGRQLQQAQREHVRVARRLQTLLKGLGGTLDGEPEAKPLTLTEQVGDALAGLFSGSASKRANNLDELRDTILANIELVMRFRAESEELVMRHYQKSDIRHYFKCDRELTALKAEFGKMTLRIARLRMRAVAA